MMIYLFKMMISDSYVSHNQRVYIHVYIYIFQYMIP